MTDDITIPPDALEAAYDARLNGGTLEDICIAMLKAWPKMHIGAPWVIGVPNAPSIILPLPKEGA
jgi:hypothetical protein